MKRSKNIPLIHNYCDRWCERCAFTDHCAIYEEPQDPRSPEHDITNKAFWDALSGKLAEATQMLIKMAAEAGIDLTNLPEETPEEKEAERKRKQTIATHPLRKLSAGYTKAGMDWMNKHADINEKENLALLKLDLSTSSTLNDCFEVIQWYLPFIEVKLARALSGKSRGRENDEFPKDSDGSAKVALIAMERSTEAWQFLFEQLPQHQDEILKWMMLLQKIKNTTEKEFPNARAFVRPGFDEEQ
jgi:hypothetical protein